MCRVSSVSLMNREDPVKVRVGRNLTAREKVIPEKVISGKEIGAEAKKVPPPIVSKKHPALPPCSGVDVFWVSIWGEKNSGAVPILETSYVPYV